MNNLVIVESPTKGRTLQRFLGDKYQIEASMGHVRDLPKSDFGVDIEHDFEPQYVVPRDKSKRVNELKKTASLAKTLWLATDPDREGEAIAWHIAELLRNSERKAKNEKRKAAEVKRVVFHEITEDAIKEAFENPRQINLKLVDAQQARRVLDRLVGYKLSPLLWQKVKKGLSAGRVQSVVLRLIVEREREIKAFKPQEYWIIEAVLESARQGAKNRSRDQVARLGFVSRQATDSEPQVSAVRSTAPHFLAAPDLAASATFIATLIEQNGKKLAIKNKEEADEHVKNLQSADYIVSKITQKEVRRYPYPPLITSTMQQAASIRLGFSVKKTMMLAQVLYEHGLITYMRTDSVNLSASAISAVREYIKGSIGRSYLPATPRLYKSRSKNVQEAHEAIRVTDVRRAVSDIREVGGLNRDHARLYELIWKRFVACQMSEAVLDQTIVDVEAIASSTSEVKSPNTSEVYLLRATGSVIKFEGWLRLYGKEVEDRGEERKQVLPPLSEKQPLNLIQLLPTQHFTEPQPRYTEASLIKKLEELGIGRPSTYAPIISTIQERYYVEKEDRKFLATPLGFAVNDFLVKYFPDIVDYSFTAQMEDELDEISRGERQWKPTIRAFYEPFEKKLEQTTRTAERVKMELQKVDKKCPSCGKDLVIRIGKFGKFLACSGFPECKYTESLEEKVNAICPQDGGEIVIRHTRRGKTFYGCKNYPGCKFASWTKPKRGSSEQATGNSKQ